MSSRLFLVYQSYKGIHIDRCEGAKGELHKWLWDHSGSPPRSWRFGSVPGYSRIKNSRRTSRWILAEKVWSKRGVGLAEPCIQQRHPHSHLWWRGPFACYPGRFQIPWSVYFVAPLATKVHEIQQVVHFFYPKKTVIWHLWKRDAATNS